MNELFNYFSGILIGLLAAIYNFIKENFNFIVAFGTIIYVAHFFDDQFKKINDSLEEIKDHFNIE